MTRLLLAIVSVFESWSPAFAQQPPAAAGWPIAPDLVQLTVTVLGMLLAARLASGAFAERAVPVADVPIFPRYMTSPTQYRLGTTGPSDPRQV